MAERIYNQDQQISSQPEATNQEPVQNGRLRRIIKVGTVMAAMLAVNAGFTYAVKRPNNNESEINPQAMTDILGGIGSFDQPESIDPPTGWSIIATNVTPNHTNIVAWSGYSIDVETSGTSTCESNGWLTQQQYTVNPNNTYTLGFVAAYISGESPNGIDPKVKLDWKNSLGQSLNSPDNHTFTGVDHADTWGLYNRTYGPGQEATIPTQAAKVTVEIQGNQTNPSCSGKLYVDNLALSTAAVSPTPTPPLGVGGVAHKVDIETLPADSSEENNSSERNVLIAGLVIGTLALGASGVAISSIRKERQK